MQETNTDEKGSRRSTEPYSRWCDFPIAANASGWWCLQSAKRAGEATTENIKKGLIVRTKQKYTVIQAHSKSSCLCHWFLPSCSWDCAILNSAMASNNWDIYYPDADGNIKFDSSIFLKVFSQSCTSNLRHDGSDYIQIIAICPEPSRRHVVLAVMHGRSPIGLQDIMWRRFGSVSHQDFGNTLANQFLNHDLQIRQHRLTHPRECI